MTEQHSVIGVDTANVSSAADHMLGELAWGSEGTEWVYVNFEAAVKQYHAVEIDENYNASPLTIANMTNGYDIGFTQVAANSGEKGWVAKRGSNIKALVAASCNADVALFATSTAGVLDDAGGTATDRIDGVVAVTGSTTATAKAVEVIARYPHSTNISGGT